MSERIGGHTDAFPRGCRWIDLPTVTDERGVLTFLEESVHIPFQVRRVFWIYNVPKNKKRGGHAHWICSEVLFVMQGAVDLTVDDGYIRTTVHLDSPERGFLIPAGVWCDLDGFLPGTICVVAASHAYDPEGYVNDYEQFRQDVLCK